jgi:hypothetical protein
MTRFLCAAERFRQNALLLVAPFSAVLLCLALLATPAAATTLQDASHSPTDPPGCAFCVSGDPAGGTVDGVGTGSAPPTSPPSSVPTGTTCEGCRYMWLDACPGNNVMADGEGGFVNAVNNPCLQAEQNCPAGERLQQLYVLIPPGQVTLGPTLCRGGNALPPTPGQIGEAAADAFSRLLTTASPTFQPAPRALVNLPTLFATNVPASQTFSETLLGQRVTITVNASWRWDFGDGETLTTSNAGGAYPNTSLSHDYVQPGSYTVRVTTDWTGTYSVNGGPSLPIPGGVVPRPTPLFTVEVAEAHAVLVS